MTVLWIALGSALGGVSRYLVSRLLNGADGFPWGTWCVNVFGTLAIGALSGWLAHGSAHAAVVRAFAVIGFCGSFTTFSTFSNETFRMLENNQWFPAAAYVGISVLAGLAAVFVGCWLSKGVCA